MIGFSKHLTEGNKYMTGLVFNQCSKLLGDIFEHNGVDQTHGLSHALRVTYHASQSILSLQKGQIAEQQRQNIVLAALLHDADDKKYFPHNVELQNCVMILSANQLPPARITRIVQMINAVSFSKNGDNIVQTDHSFYIPRYADRLQAIGLIGILRSYQYNEDQNRLLVTPNTIKPKNRSQMWKLVDGRDKQYIRKGGQSESFIDHIYDKLIHISLPIKNPYLQRYYKLSQQDIINFVLKCSENNYQNIQAAIKEVKLQIERRNGLMTTTEL